MVQLIINGQALPYTSNDKYACYPSQLSTHIDMISGRRVNEMRGNVQMITYSYDYMGNSAWNTLAGNLRSGQPLDVCYLADDSSEMKTGQFFCERLTNPTFAFERSGEARWHNISFTLREVRPHD